jgi:DNA-binding CsgD family transcriptional regulator
MARRLTAERFIGRTDLLELFDEMLESAHAGRGDMLLIGGEAGVGKSRATAELTTRAQRDGAVVLVGWCVENGEQVLPLAPVADILRGIATLFQSSEWDQAPGLDGVVLSRLVPDLVTTDLPDHGEIRSAPRRLFDGILDAIRALSDRRSVVITVEDLHWADESTRQLLAYLAPRLANHRVVLIATYRSDELHRRHPLRPFLVSLRRAVRPEQHEIQPFTETELAELVQSLTRNTPDGRFITALFNRCAGNAFFAEELIAGGQQMHLPGVLRDAVLGRTAGLDGRQLAVLRVAAVAGHQVGIDVLGAVCEMEAPDIAGAVDALVENGLSIRTGDGIRFRHELAREIVESEILGAERVALHHSLASTLLTLTPGRRGDIARHWMLAGDQPRALEASVAAGRDAAAISADSEALLHLERALELWSRVPDAEQRAGCSHGQLLLEASDAAGRARSFDRAFALGLQALELPSDDPVVEGISCLRLADWAWWNDKADAADGLIGRALSLIPAEPPTPERALAMAWDALLLTDHRRPGADERQAEALALARACGARRAEAHVLTTIGAGRCNRDDPSGLDAHRQALALAMTDGLTRDAGRAFDELTFSLTRLGRYQEVVAMEQEALDFCAATGLQRFYGVEIELSVIRCLQRLGRWADAEARVARVRDEFGDLRLEHFTLAGSWGLILVRQARLEGVSDMVIDAVTRLPGHFGILRQVAATAVELADAEGRVADIPALVEPALHRVLFGSGCDAAEVVASAIGAIADRASATGARSRSGPARAMRDVCATWLLEVDDFSAAIIRAGTFPELTLRVGQARAEFARLNGEPVTEQWRELIEGWDRLQMPYEASHSRWRLAGALLASATGRSVETRAEARALLTAARDSATVMGAVRLIQGIDALDRRAHLNLAVERERAPVPPEGGLGLTGREAEVLRLVAAGYSNGQIGQALYISRKTASVHVSNILRKLGVSGRVEAAAIAANDTHRATESGQQPSGNGTR